MKCLNPKCSGVETALTTVMDVTQCQSCGAAYAGAVPLYPLIARLKLGDDTLKAATSPTTVGTTVSIPREIAVAWARIQTAFADLDGGVSQLASQLQGRAHFLHGELARLAIAQEGLAPLVETAKQIIDLVSGKPDGVTKPDPG